jgi:high-affinity iron transporter
MLAKTTLVLSIVLSATLAGAADADSVADLFAAQCSLCHGEKGKGDGLAAAMLQPPPTNFAAAGYWAKADRAALRKTIHDGKTGTSMTGFGGKLSDAQIDALLKYLEGLGGGG